MNVQAPAARLRVGFFEASVQSECGETWYRESVCWFYCYFYFNIACLLWGFYSTAMERCRIFQNSTTTEKWRKWETRQIESDIRSMAKKEHQAHHTSKVTLSNADKILRRRRTPNNNIDLAFVAGIRCHWHARQRSSALCEVDCRLTMNEGLLMKWRIQHEPQW